MYSSVYNQVTWWWLDRYPPGRKSSHNWPVYLTIELATICAQIRPSDRVQLEWMKKPTTFWLLCNHLYVYHCQWFTGLLFLGLSSQACLTCSSVQVVFKWQWCDWTGQVLTHLEIFTWTRSSKWLLFVIPRAQMVKWDYISVSDQLVQMKNLPLHGSLPPLTSTPM